MRDSCKLPVTIKCRIGVDSNDSYPELVEFVKTVSQEAGVTKFIIHARKAFLKGLNPKDNRTIPPLNY
jgi:tRNA-dihydrouridine synthase A